METQAVSAQRPDPGPRCDPADVEIWEQLQRALTKLDQAEQREKELRRERDQALRERDREAAVAVTSEVEWFKRAAKAERERDEAQAESRKAIRIAFEADPNNLVPYEQTMRAQEERAEQAEAQRDALAEALSELAGEYGCMLLEPADPSLPPVDREACRDERPNQRQTWCYACIARSALDALDQTNREVKP